MAEGMPEFTKGEVSGGMMQVFAQAFGDALTAMPTGQTTEVAFGTTQIWADIPFEFRHGAATDFPGASILIGKKVYYMHWTPLMCPIPYVMRFTKRIRYCRVCIKVTAIWFISVCLYVHWIITT